MAARVGSSENLRVRCPRCGSEGEVPRSATGQIWGCTTCKKWVYIDRRGRAHARIRPPDPRLVSVTLDVRCPQCGTRRKASPRQLQHLLVCPGCAQPLWVAPNGQLLVGPRAVAEHRRALSRNMHGESRSVRGSCRPRRVPSWLRQRARLLGLVLLALVLLVAVGRNRTPRPSPGDGIHETAQNFVAALLVGEKQKAAVYVDPAALDAFEQWWLMNRATLEAAFGKSTAGTITSIEVEHSGPASAQVSVRVRVRSRSLQYILSLVRRGETWVVQPRGGAAEQAALTQQRPP